MLRLVSTYSKYSMIGKEEQAVEQSKEEQPRKLY